MLPARLTQMVEHVRLIRLFKSDLAREIEDWATDGLITQEQAESISLRYGIDYRSRDDQSRRYAVLVGLGYSFIGLAIITIVSANWDEIPRMVRMLGLIGTTLAINLLALYLHSFTGRKTEAIGFFLLGGLSYGASIMLIAQVYHLGQHFPDGILWWAIGVAPFAILLESVAVTVLMLCLGVLWFFVESMQSFFPTLFPLFLAVGGYVLYRVKKSAVLVFLLLVGLVSWVVFSLAWVMGTYDRFEFGAEHTVLVSGLFIISHAIGKWLVTQTSPVLVDHGTLISVWVLRFAVVSLFIFSFELPWAALIRADWEYPVTTVVSALGVSAISLSIAWRADRNFQSTAAFCGLYVVCVAGVVNAINTANALLFQIGANIFIVSFGVWLIVRGLREGLSHYFTLGVSVILLTGLLRYIDLVGDYLGASILFIIFAAILLVVARFWRVYFSDLGESI